MTEPSIWDELAPVVNADKVKRDKLDRPMVFAPDYEGVLDFTQGKTVKGRTGYTRTTTFVDCLDDKSAISLYNMRNVLRGIVERPMLMVDAKEAVAIGDADDPIVKGALNGVVGQAREAAYEDAKADTGTVVHWLCELVDLVLADGDILPFVALENLQDLAAESVQRDTCPSQALIALAEHRGLGVSDLVERHRADVAAYLRATVPYLRPVLIEALTIQDTLKVAGTPDRFCEWIGPRVFIPVSKTVLVPVEPGDVLVVDLKTGSVEYGIGKFGMQLGMYANGEVYDQSTNTRTPLPERLRRDWALIVHAPAGTGQASLLWLDIGKGWAAARTLAPKVRTWRNVGKKLSRPWPELTLRERVVAALTADEVRALWRANKDEWTPELTEIGKGKP